MNTHQIRTAADIEEITGLWDPVEVGELSPEEQGRLHALCEALGHGDGVIGARGPSDRLAAFEGLHVGARWVEEADRGFEQAKQRLEEAVNAVAQEAQGLEVLEQTPSSITVGLHDWNGLQRAIQEWRAATQGFLAACAKG